MSLLCKVIAPVWGVLISSSIQKYVNLKHSIPHNTDPDKGLNEKAFPADLKHSVYIQSTTLF